MAEFVFSAFADEADGSIDKQIEVLKKEEIKKIELRGVDGQSCADISIDKAKEVNGKLSNAGITLSALGSPYGKIGITDDFEPHLDKFKKSLEVCKIFKCDRIRMFSFYIPEGKKAEEYRGEVFARLEEMVKLAKEAKITLCHENEKGIYGDTDSRCMDLKEHFGDELGIIFDPANYIQCGVDPWEAYEKQKDMITYFHVKDALKKDGSVVSAGNGDGSLAKILFNVNKSTDKEMILTVEPHLAVFNGLSDLQSEKLLHKEYYPDSVSAFHAACMATKKIVSGIR